MTSFLSLVLPSDAAAAAQAAVAHPTFAFKAGGTDVVDRIRRRAAAPEGLIQLRRLTGLDAIAAESKGIRMGALVTLADVSEHPAVKDYFPLLAEAATATATPQIRSRATVGGALCQRPRCSYYRDASFHCAKKGGAQCLAREGEHRDHAIFDNAVCMAPHPSTLAAALTALDAVVWVRTPMGELTSWTMDKLFDYDRTRASLDNALPPGALIEAVVLEAESTPTKHRYLRASSRELADWASAEVAVQLGVVDGKVVKARVVLGGVARAPHRAHAAEAALMNTAVTQGTLEKAAAAALEGATPMPANKWKVPLARQLVLTALEDALQ